MRLCGATAYFSIFLENKIIFGKPKKELEEKDQTKALIRTSCVYIYVDIGIVVMLL